VAYVNFMFVLHKTTKRNYLVLVNEPECTKAKAATLPLCLTSFDTAQFRLQFREGFASPVVSYTESNNS